MKIQNNEQRNESLISCKQIDDIKTDYLNDDLLGGMVLKNNYLMWSSPVGTIVKLETDAMNSNQLKRTTNFEAMRWDQQNLQTKDNYKNLLRKPEDGYFMQKRGVID